MDRAELVDIDTEGTFKYVHMVLTNDDMKRRDAITGHAWGAYHDDLYQAYKARAKAKGEMCAITGGGRIRHDPEQKELFVYGYSQGYGRANHEFTVELIKQDPRYKDYSVTWSNEGY